MMQKAKTLMIMGTMSSAGKSLLTAGLCRLFARQGWKTLPFKAQNMSNNAAVCPLGGEIGRAQAVQAEAAGAVPIVEMNPILLKPEADRKSQVIVLGKPIGSYSGRDYYAQRETLWQPVCQSLDMLRKQADIVLIEGAGSIAELNLQKSDIVNMAVARYAKAPCVLVGDIDRGGIFAQLAGSWWLLDPTERSHLKGFIVNKFRGDPALFADGIQIIENRTEGVPVLGVVPFLSNHGIADEDAASFSPITEKYPNAAKIGMIRLPHISNFDEFDALKQESHVNLTFCTMPNQLESVKAIILPGTKNTIEDVQWLNQSGFSEAILRLWREGIAVVGICGGYQIMGQRILNPDHLECAIPQIDGLGIFPVHTILTPTKTVTQTEAQIQTQIGFLQELEGATVKGYEIHTGATTPVHPILQITRQGITPCNIAEGMIAHDGRSFGTYLHGIFDNDSFRDAWLRSLGIPPDRTHFRQKQEQSFDQLANHLEQHLNMKKLIEIMEKGVV